MKIVRGLDRIVTGAVLLCPLFLTHGRGLAEAAIDVSAIGFLLRSLIAADWDWLRRPWVVAAALWWGWLCVCSVPFGIGGWPGLLQAIASVRFLVFVACVQHLALRPPGALRAMRWLIAACGIYIAAQLLLQAVIGHNLFGMPRFGDGTLTGPYDKPRAAAPLSRLLLPLVLAASAWILGRDAPKQGWMRAGLAALPPVIGIAVMVLAGQRMPLLLTLLGLLVAGLMLRRLRPMLLGVLVGAPILVAASALVSPHSFGHLVLLFERQMSHFGQSPYGLIYTRAVSIALSNPLTGLGFDGFRHGCADPAYFHSWPPWSDAAPAGDGGGAAICVQHAHNHALQALTDSGLPGLLLFGAMVTAWLFALGRGLWRGPGQGSGRAAPGGESASAQVRLVWRTGLFAAVFIHEWPFASASAFTNMPLGGWFFLLLGVGLAEAYMQPQQPMLRSDRSHV